MTPDDMRLEPHDILAEQSVLGAMLISQAAVETALARVTPGDFYRPAHRIIFEAITAIARSGEPLDATIVMARLQSENWLHVVGGGPYLHTLMETCLTPANITHYTAIVRERAVRRRLIAASRGITQRAYAADGEDAVGLAEMAVRELESVRDFEISEDDAASTLTIKEFLEVKDEEYDWIVPDLLERGDRMILTGTEGLGKSTLFRQLAVTIAAGIHPFDHYEIEPKRVLVVDVENTPKQVRRKIRPMVAQAELQRRPIEETNLWLEIRPEGLDLANDRDVSWLLRRISLIRPDIVFLGPLYRLAPRALNTDDEAAPILAVLNMIRAKGACVLLEAHAGHALMAGGRRDLRPRGSSALLGWPECGYGIRRADTEEAKSRRIVDFESWRGDRDERNWPERLGAGGVWPWSAMQIGHEPPVEWSPTAGLRGA
ncbi:DnaB-like helicase N-terminal domain-containing protein [Microbispora sp. ATCC PTA-5024]|uniref:DnaB-like helicase N-terminal domain-containing protein n=1 Tax=Microbispora sp. ATCC PTA-5024 TaxID=316330 RepID=UPI0003DBDF96|nr:DnaB-like helicase N-terminal domain-containing protein [Microbispora sp. ATCC PTA-5024]ETK36162.1 hypothetical protein MPTA5024_11085 [Microbispora sp. ATCC PTA-5024]